MSIVTRSCRVPTDDQRRALWAFKFFGGGHHHIQPKPRIRVKPRIRIVHSRKEQHA